MQNQMDCDIEQENERSDKDRLIERIKSNKLVKIISLKFRLIINNDELWNIFVFIGVFITILITSKLGIYGIDDNIIYAFSLSSLILSISQVTKNKVSKVFYLIGNIVMIIGVKLNVEVINWMKSIINDKTLLILSMLVIFIGALINKIDKIQRENNIYIRNKTINEYIDSLEEKYKEQKKSFEGNIARIGMLLEVVDIEHQEKMDERFEIENEVNSDKTFEDYIKYTRKLINNELDE